MIYKFNGGEGAVLCENCRKIIYTASTLPMGLRKLMYHAEKNGKPYSSLPPVYCCEDCKESMTEVIGDKEKELLHELLEIVDSYDSDKSIENQTTLLQKLVILEAKYGEESYFTSDYDEHIRELRKNLESSVGKGKFARTLSIAMKGKPDHYTGFDGQLCLDVNTNNVYMKVSGDWVKLNTDDII